MLVEFLFLGQREKRNKVEAKHRPMVPYYGMYRREKGNAWKISRRKWEYQKAWTLIKMAPTTTKSSLCFANFSEFSSEERKPTQNSKSSFSKTFGYLFLYIFNFCNIARSIYFIARINWYLTSFGCRLRNIAFSSFKFHVFRLFFFDKYWFVMISVLPVIRD